MAAQKQYHITAQLDKELKQSAVMEFLVSEGVNEVRIQEWVKEVHGYATMDMIIAVWMSKTDQWHGHSTH